MGSGYSVNYHVRFLGGWAPVMEPGYPVSLAEALRFPTFIGSMGL
jgi:hypothetical protein